MNNKLIGFLVTIMVTGSITGCSKQTERSAVKKRLVGTWQWVRTEGGFAYHIETPATTGKNIDLKIGSNGKYSIYTNNVLTSEGTYVLETRNCIHDHTDKTFVNFSSDYAVMIEKIDNENLEVSDEFYDGTGSSYKRKN